MNNGAKKNYLILGASSNIAKEVIFFLGQKMNNFYGLSTNPESTNNGIFNKLVSYKDYHQFSEIEFSNVFVIASRNHTQGGSLNDYLEVNKLVISILNKIKYSQTKSPKFTFLSSFSVYDKNATYIDENTALMPADYYGESKILLEESLKDISEEFDGDLLICRLPVFLYQGVNKVNGNFLAKLSLAINSKSAFSLTNPDAFLGAVFNVDSLVKLDSKKIDKLKIVNCSSRPDITFHQIGELAIKHGLKEVNWKQSNRPSAQICLKRVSKILGYQPSARKIIEQWLPGELS
jgi:nucleoside-diphosphate-sugar epimerase